MENNKSTRVIIFLVFLLCTVLLGYLIISEVNNVRKVNIEIERLKNITIQKQAYLAELRRGKDNLDLLEENNRTLTQMIPNSMYEDSIILDLQNYAQQCNVALISVNFMQRSEKEIFVTMPLTMSLQGTHKNFLNLLSNILHEERLFIIDSIQLKKDNNGLNIDIKAKAFCTTK